MRSFPLAFTLLLLLGCAPLLTAQQVWVVEKTGQGDFNEIQPAIDAALPGDRIEVIAQALFVSYLPFTLDKGVTVVGIPTMDGTPAVVQQFAKIDGIPAGELAVLDRIQIAGAALVSDPALEVLNSQGSVLVRHMQVFGAVGTGIRVSGCQNVHFDMVNAAGGGFAGSEPLNAGFLSLVSRVSLNGGAFVAPLGVPGPGMLAVFGYVSAANVSLNTVETVGEGYLQRCGYLGAPPSNYGISDCNPPTGNNRPSSVGLEATREVQLGGALTMAADGQAAGGAVAVFASSRLGFARLAGIEGAFFLDLATAIPVVVVGAGGASINIPMLPQLDGQYVFLQGLGVSSSGFNFTEVVATRLRL